MLQLDNMLPGLYMHEHTYAQTYVRRLTHVKLLYRLQQHGITKAESASSRQAQYKSNHGLA